MRGEILILVLILIGTGSASEWKIEVDENGSAKISITIFLDEENYKKAKEVASQPGFMEGVKEGMKEDFGEWAEISELSINFFDDERKIEESFILHGFAWLNGSVWETRELRVENASVLVKIPEQWVIYGKGKSEASWENTRLLPKIRYGVPTPEPTPSPVTVSVQEKKRAPSFEIWIAITLILLIAKKGNMLKRNILWRKNE
jgi:hypothetical protein